MMFVDEIPSTPPETPPETPPDFNPQEMDFDPLRDSDSLTIVPDTYWDYFSHGAQSTRSWKDIKGFCVNADGFPLEEGSYWTAPIPTTTSNRLSLSTDPQGKGGNFALKIAAGVICKIQVTIHQRDTEYYSEYVPPIGPPIAEGDFDGDGVPNRQDPDHYREVDYSDTFDVILIGGDYLSVNVNPDSGIQELSIIKNGRDYINRNIVNEINMVYGADSMEGIVGEIEIVLILEKFEMASLPPQEDEVEEEEEEEQGQTSDWSQDDSWTLLGALILGLIAIYIIHNLGKGGVVEG